VDSGDPTKKPRRGDSGASQELVTAVRCRLSDTNEWGRAVSPHRLEHYFREARATVKDLPDGFRFHDQRHYFASLLIAQGLDVKVVQKSLRHSSAKTTLDTYGHMWPDKEESARAAVSRVLADRTAQPKPAARTS